MWISDAPGGRPRDFSEWRRRAARMHLVDWIRLARWRDWFQSKLPFITAGALLLVPPDERPLTIVEMMVTVAFWAAFGYGVNDIADRPADGRAGKANQAAQISIASRTLFLMFTAGGALTVCLVWASDAAAPAFVVAGLVMALAYSVRPIRLKERGVWGLLTAAVAQWSLPILAVSAAQPGGWLRPLAWLLSALGLAIGLRWMAVHQLQDAAADRRADVRTYASSGADVWAGARRVRSRGKSSHWWRSCCSVGRCRCRRSLHSPFGHSGGQRSDARLDLSARSSKGMKRLRWPNTTF